MIGFNFVKGILSKITINIISLSIPCGLFDRTAAIGCKHYTTTRCEKLQFRSIPYYTQLNL